MPPRAVWLLAAALAVCATRAATGSMPPPPFVQFVQLDAQQADCAWRTCGACVQCARMRRAVAHLPRPPRAAHNKKSIDGKIKLNGQTYEVVCDCSKNWKVHIVEQANQTQPECMPPTKFKILRVGGQRDANFTAQHVREFIGLPSELQYVSVADQPFASIDNQCVLRHCAAPGRRTLPLTLLRTVARSPSCLRWEATWASSFWRLPCTRRSWARR